MDDFKILIEGIGGVGGVISSKLISAGFDVTLVTANQKITEKINENGIKLIERGNTFQVDAKAYTSIDELPKSTKFDSVFLIMKATSVLEATEKTIPYLTKEGYVVTYQNGVIEDDVSEIIGEDRIISAVVSWGGTMLEPGIYEKTSTGNIHLGELNGKITGRLTKLQKIVEFVAPVVVSENIRGVLWTKLAFNCSITTIGVLTGEKLGTMLKNKETMKLFGRTCSEVIETAEANNIKLEKLVSDPYLLYVSKDANWFKRSIKDVLVRIVGRKYGKIKSSSLQSIERGRKTEVEYLNGYVVKKAKEKDLDVPFNSALVKMVKEIESGERKIVQDNITELITELSF